MAAVPPPPQAGAALLAACGRNDVAGVRWEEAHGASLSAVQPFYALVEDVTGQTLLECRRRSPLMVAASSGR